MNSVVKQIQACRICGSQDLSTVLDLGKQALTGVFPKHIDTPVTSGPLELVLCTNCGLLQLRHSFDHNEMYGMNYGYRSGLNISMVRHLEQKAQLLEKICPVGKGDVVVDIGSNDATFLKSYTKTGLRRIGIDPTNDKFKSFYPEEIQRVPDFFSKSVFKKICPDKHAKIISSIAMLYDLEYPKQFVEDIASILDKEGIWHFEQSYMPSMLDMNAYDTVCHEHIEYYSLAVIKNLLESCDLKIIDVGMNAVNGGSFAVTAARKEASYKTNAPLIEWFLKREDDMEITTTKPYRFFEQRIKEHRKALRDLLSHLQGHGKTVLGYGASTKGNVMLQYCNLTPRQIPFIAEVNPNKFGAFTPHTHIPIISEAEAKKMKPDYMLVLPWHFKQTIIQKEWDYLKSGGKLIFPLPQIEIM